MSPGLDYASENYRWFSARSSDFLYIDRIVLAPRVQGLGLGGACTRPRSTLRASAARANCSPRSTSNRRTPVRSPSTPGWASSGSASNPRRTAQSSSPSWPRRFRRLRGEDGEERFGTWLSSRASPSCSPDADGSLARRELLCCLRPTTSSAPGFRKVRTGPSRGSNSPKMGRLFRPGVPALSEEFVDERITFVVDWNAPEDATGSWEIGSKWSEQMAHRVELRLRRGSPDRPVVHRSRRRCDDQLHHRRSGFPAPLRAHEGNVTAG